MQEGYIAVFIAEGSISFPFNLDSQSPTLKRTKILRPPDVSISEQYSLQVSFSTFVFQRSSSSLRVMRVRFQCSLRPNLWDGKERIEHRLRTATAARCPAVPPSMRPEEETRRKAGSAFHSNCSGPQGPHVWRGGRKGVMPGLAGPFQMDSVGIGSRRVRSVQTCRIHIKVSITHGNGQEPFNAKLENTLQDFWPTVSSQDRSMDAKEKTFSVPSGRCRIGTNWRFFAKSIR